MIVRNEVIDKVRRVYESYGYLPIDTPVLELLPTLVGTGGEETDKLIFTLESPEQQQIGMRFDLTVPFARIIAQYNPNEIKLPFRRYHIGPVFRADDPQPEQGRFRQFTQFDIDIAGTNSVAADAEIVAAMSEALQAVGLSHDKNDAVYRYFIRLNNRQAVDAFLLGLGIDNPETAKHVMRVIDKRDKLTSDELVDELGPGRVDASGDPVRGVGLDQPKTQAILDFISIKADRRVDVVAALEKSIRPSPLRETALAEVNLLCAHLDAMGVSDEAARLDPSLARGLDYYTGTVFEGTLPNAGVGSVMGGGRYDGLVSRFLDEPIPATGASIGLDRLVTGLRNLGLEAGRRRNTAEVLVLVMPGVPEPEASRVAAELRAASIPAELYVGDAMGKVGRQLAFANARGMSVAVLLGEGELAQGVVAVKDLQEGSEVRDGISEREEYRAAGTAGQQTVPRRELVAAVGRLLESANGKLGPR
jgi:histidyl-tRNA synthetase